MNRIRSTNDRLVDVIVFDPKKNIKLQPVTPLMPLEALLIPVNLTDIDCDGINGGTGCNFIYFFIVDAPIHCASFYVERIDLTSKLRKIGPKWQRNRPFSAKKSPHKFSNTDPSNLIISWLTHFKQTFH